MLLLAASLHDRRLQEVRLESLSEIVSPWGRLPFWEVIRYQRCGNTT
jgi:hypothetical protein